MPALSEQRLKPTSPSSAYPDTIFILQGYPEYLNGKKHSGIDIYCRDRHYCVAVEPGKIIKTRKGNGKSLSITTLKGEASGCDLIYKHTVSVPSLNSSVSQGEKIGYLDDSGKDVNLWDGYHLHFQVEFEGLPIDPVKYFLIYHSKIKFFMRRKVIEYYSKKDYFLQMNYIEKEG